MRIHVACISASRHIANDGKTLVYKASFGVLVTPGIPVQVSGSLSIESKEPLHYKPLKKYRIDIDEDSGIITPGSPLTQ